MKATLIEIVTEPETIWDTLWYAKRAGERYWCQRAPNWCVRDDDWQVIPGQGEAAEGMEIFAEHARVIREGAVRLCLVEVEACSDGR